MGSNIPNVEDLLIDPDEAEHGIAFGFVVKWRRLTMVMMETTSGLMITGYSYAKRTEPGDAKIGLAIARRNAMLRLDALRDPERNREVALPSLPTSRRAPAVAP